MAEARPRFGIQSSADVKLFLTGPGEENYGRNPVYLHSQILKRLKCFEGKFSNRRSSDKSAEIWLTTSHNFDHYLKCIEIMYGERVDFLNIEECLGILSVASEMLADDCINKCMQYLEAVRWNAEQESQIRNVLSRQGLKLSPDLAARLQQDDGDDINFVEKIIQEMVSLIKGDQCLSSRNREIVLKYLEGILDRNTSSDVVEVCGRVLLKEFQSSIKSQHFSILMRLFKLIQHCDRTILEAALKAFCEDAEFIEAVNKEYCHRCPEYGEVVSDLIIWLMKEIADGKMIISAASRVSFLTTWVPIMGNFESHSSLINRFEQLDKAVLNVVESLPQVEQKRICVLWAEVYRSRDIDIATPFNLAERLLL